MEQQLNADTPVVSEIEKEAEVDLDNNFGVEEAGEVKLAYKRSTDISMYVPRVHLLLRSLGNKPPLPTQILFPNQKKEAIELVNKYIENIGLLVKSLGEHGVGIEVESYAYRVAHMLNEQEWVNIVVRLQFATAFYDILQTLNQNLDKDVENKWGVLEIKDGVYSINGRPLKFGDRIDIFTTDETIHGNVVFNSHEVLNCPKVNGDALPVAHIPLDELDNLDASAKEKRARGGYGDDRQMLGVDAWSFLNILLYRINDDESEDVIQIETDILSKLDLDPEIDQTRYREIALLLNNEDLPLGLNHTLLAAYRDYYCKNKEVFDRFCDNVDKLYANQEKFRSNLNAVKLEDNAVISNIHNALLYLDNKSKLMRIKLIMMDGTSKDAVTITRTISMGALGTFARYNPTPILFQEIDYDTRPKTNRSFLDRIRGANKEEIVSKHNFKLVEGEPINSADVLGFVAGSAMSYYFADDSDVKLDDKFDFFHKLKKKFKYVK